MDTKQIPPSSVPELLEFSIVVPCYNEEGSIRNVIDGLKDLPWGDRNYEIIVVDDGSKDQSWNVICSVVGDFKNVIGLRQMVNFGQTQAYQAGFAQAKGKFVITFSADLETPCDNVIKVCEKLEEGYDFVNTWRVDRWHGSRAFLSITANKLINLVSGLHIHDRGSGLKGMTATIAKHLPLYGEGHRFLPDLASMFTDRICEFDVEFLERQQGESAYAGTRRSVKVFLDLVALYFILRTLRKPYSMRPGRVFGFTGFAIAGVGITISAWLIFLRVIASDELSNRPLFLLALLSSVLGIVMVMLGVLGELIVKTYCQSGGIPNYLVREKAFPNKNSSEASSDI